MNAQQLRRSVLLRVSVMLTVMLSVMGSRVSAQRPDSPTAQRSESGSPQTSLPASPSVSLPGLPSITPSGSLPETSKKVMTQPRTWQQTESRRTIIPSNAKPAPSAAPSRTYKPTERIQFDSAVTFPTDI